MAQDTPFVPVTVGSPDSAGGGQFDSEYTLNTDSMAIWNDYVIINKYEQDLHRYFAGVTSPNGLTPGNPIKVGIFQLARPTLIWICDWTASRSKVKPAIPPPIVNNPNWVLLDAHQENYKKELELDRDTDIWRISGTYFYVHVNPDPNFILNTDIPMPPYLLDSESPRTLSTDIYQNNISTAPNSYRLTTGGVGNVPGR